MWPRPGGVSRNGPRGVLGHGKIVLETFRGVNLLGVLGLAPISLGSYLPTNKQGPLELELVLSVLLVTSPAPSFKLLRSAPRQQARLGWWSMLAGTHQEACPSCCCCRRGIFSGRGIFLSGDETCAWACGTHLWGDTTRSVRAVLSALRDAESLQA